MFRLKSRTWLALALVCQISAKAAASQCDMLLEDRHNYEVISGGGFGFLGALVPGGALVTGLATGLATAASDANNSSNQGNKSDKEIALRDFFARRQPKPDAVDLDKIGFRMATENAPSSGCQIRAMIQTTRLFGGRYGGDIIEQTFKIVRTVNGEISESNDLKIASVVRLLIFQRKPTKRLKEDSRTGKYIDVTSPMIDSDIYNQKIANIYSKITVRHLSKALKKAKIFEK